MNRLGTPPDTPEAWPAGDPQHGHVYLVGAGPGDPSLLTLRAYMLLSRAAVILPDDLVSEEILALANPAALVIPVGKRCGQPRITQAGIHALMLDHARAGRSVVRLKSGDPLVFGRAGEEIDALRAADVPFEIVPGITTAFAVAASLKTPLTDRDSASRLILATAHHAAGKTAAPLFHGSGTESATLAIYMPGRDLGLLASSLLASGIPPSTPAVAVSNASTPRERTVLTTVDSLASIEPGSAPLLLLIGSAIRPNIEMDSTEKKLSEIDVATSNRSS